MTTELESALAAWAASDLDSLDIDATAEMLMPLLEGVRMRIPRIQSDLRLFRARLDAPVRTPADLSYPPPALARLGRLNREGAPMFYCSAARSAVFFELEPLAGQSLLVSRWRTTQPILLSHVGYHENVFSSLASNRQKASFDGKESPLVAFPDSESRLAALARVFAERIQPGNERRYRLSAAIAQCLLRGPADGLLYPSIAMSANADNIALRASVADEKLAFIGVERVRIEDVTPTGYQTSVLDYATADGNGVLDWKGRPPRWVISQPGGELKAVATPSGWQMFDEAGREVDPE